MSNEPHRQIFIPGVSAAQPTTNTVVHHVFIIDASGSMAPLRQAIITGFNEQVQNIRELERALPDQLNRATLVFFNRNIDTRFFDTETDSLREITLADYSPSGLTRLYATIGDIVTQMQQTLGDRASAERVIFTIMTDGVNTEAHAIWNQSSVKEKLQQVQNDHNWVVTFIGANIDVQQVSNSLGIPAANTVAFSASERSSRAVFRESSRSRIAYMRASHGAGGQSVSNLAYYSPEGSAGINLADKPSNPDPPHTLSSLSKPASPPATEPVASIT